VTVDGVAAVQARIVQIQQLISGSISAAGGPDATGAAASGTASSAAGTADPEFASLLADAMASGAATSDPLSDSSSDTTSTGDSTMLSQLAQLSQIGSAGTSGSSLLDTILGANSTGASGTSGTTDIGALLGANGSSPLDAALTSAGITGADTASLLAPTGNTLAQSFLTTALQEQGKPYVYGATASPTDPNPKAFDCSELTKWAAARVGVTIPDGATAQYLYIRDHGDTMTVQQALHTPGALLFHFSHEPKNLGDIPADGHVAISLGDGVHTIEARGAAYGTNVFDNAAGRDFDFAGMIPGMT